MLDAMLLKNGWKGGSDRRAEESSSAATVVPQNVLWCHCYHHCPEDSVNNTCMYVDTHTSHTHRIKITLSIESINTT